MNKPSSTITFAFLGGLGISLLLAGIDELTNIHMSANLQNLAVTFGSALIGYLKPENVYPEGFPPGPG